MKRIRRRRGIVILRVGWSGMNSFLMGRGMTVKSAKIREIRLKFRQKRGSLIMICGRMRLLIELRLLSGDGGFVRMGRSGCCGMGMFLFCCRKRLMSGR